MAKIETRRPTDRPAPVPDTAEKASSDPRVTLPLSTDGMLDVERMQDRSKEKVRQWLRDPTLARRLGVVPVVTAPAGTMDTIPLPVVHSIIATLGQLGAAVAERVYGCTAEQALLMTFTDAESTAIAPPLRAVLNKYGSTVLTKYGDELALAGLLATTWTNKASQVRAAMGQTPARVLTLSKPSEEKPETESQVEI